MKPSKEALVHLRPHFSRRDRQVFFLVSKRPFLSLAEEELALFDAIDGQRSMGEVSRVHPRAEEILGRWRQAGLVDWIEPSSAPKSGPHLVVIEPHIDDAALSAGGRILNRPHERITILTALSRSNFTSYWFKNRFPFDLRTVTDLRKREGALAAMLLGANHRAMDGLEANLRFVPAEEWNEESFARLYAAYPPYLHSFPPEQEIAALAVKLRTELDALAPDELWIPMGLGEHVDHHLVRDACLRMISSDRARFERIPISLYEDLPYAGQFPEHAPHLASLLHLERRVEDVSHVFDEKLRAISAFASQWKIDSLAPSIRSRAEEVKPGGLGEAYYLLREHRSPRPSELRPNARAIAETKRSLERFFDRPHRRVTVLSAGPFARFSEEMTILAGAFPSARIHAFVLEDFAWQTAPHPQVELEIVPHEPLRWAMLIAREAVLPPHPIIAVRHPSWTLKHRVLNQLMVRAFARSPSVLTIALTEVTSLLRER